MTNRQTPRGWVGTAALAALVGLACQGSPVTDPSTDMAAVRVTLARAGAGATAQAVAGWFASSTGTLARIDLGTVDSLMATLDRIEFLPAVQEGEENGENGNDETPQWMSLDIEDVRLDLLALPVTDEDGLVLVTGELPVGDYEAVRLFVTDPMLWFNTALTVGNGLTFDPDIGYPVTIPSGAQTGIKTDQGFSVAEGGGDVLLVFDENASLANVHATGNGKVMVAPVLKVRMP